jgi:type I phosphodiesterase/nucleotide pyrophosphatase
MRILRIVIVVLIAAVLARESRMTGSQSPGKGVLKTRNILLVTTDGLRWQEVFGGADSELLNREDGGVIDVTALKQQFDRNGREERRKALMPFLWSVIAKEGRIFGDPPTGSEVKVTNGRNFSYPGYNEIFTGWADSSIDNNNKVPNHNVSVLEWLNRKEAFRHRIAAYGSWDVFPYILNRWRSKLRIHAAWKPLIGKNLSEEEKVIAKLMAETPRLWEECSFDTFTFHAALGYLKRRKPRVLYIGLGETDEWGHAGRYDQYLKAAHRVDDYLKTLWETVQSMPEYRGTTTMIVTTDHGRGDAPAGWKSHGAHIKGSERIWIAVIGPDTAPRSHEDHTPFRPMTQSQIAATLAAFLGLDYRAFAPKAAPPIAEVLPPTAQGR